MMVNNRKNTKKVQYMSLNVGNNKNTLGALQAAVGVEPATWEIGVHRQVAVGNAQDGCRTLKISKMNVLLGNRDRGHASAEAEMCPK
jgi:hypothetical protein